MVDSNIRFMANQIKTSQKGLNMNTKITTTIDLTVSKNLGQTNIRNESKSISAFVSNESKIEDLVISQLKRFLKNQGIGDMDFSLEANPTNYSSLEFFREYNGYEYQVFIRVENKNKKITFPSYCAPLETTNRRDEIIEILLNDTIEKIKQDLIIKDESFLAAIILGVGFTQIGNLSIDELETEYKAVIEQELAS
jgi:hypothetical protein